MSDKPSSSKKISSFYTKPLFCKNGRPIIMNPLLSLLVVVLVLSFYAFFVPFSFVFKANDEVVYTQEDVTMISNFEKDADELEESDVVYGKDADKFYFYNNKRNLEYKSSYFKLRFKMYLTAVKNLVTLNWDDEDYVIEMKAKPEK